MSWQLISILSLSVPGTDSTCSKCLFATFSSSQVSIGQKVCEMKNESKNVQNVRHLETHDGVREDVKRLMGSTTWGLPQASWAITINCCAKGCYIRFLFVHPVCGQQLLEDRIFFASNVGTLSKGLTIILSIFSSEYCVKNVLLVQSGLRAVCNVDTGQHL